MNSLTQFKKILILPLLIALAFAVVASPAVAQEEHPNQVLEWNQIFIDTLDCDQYAELLQPAARGNRSHRDLRCLQWYRGPLHASLRSAERSQRSVASSCGHCRRAHSAGRTVSGAAAVTGCQLCGLICGAERRWRRWRPISRARHCLGNSR